MDTYRTSRSAVAHPLRSGLEISVLDDGPGAKVIHIVGEIDMCTADDFASAVTDELTGTVDSLVINLAEVTFIGSAGLAVLVEARTRAMDLGIALGVDAPHRAVRRPFELTGLADLLLVGGPGA
jgi:anti-sigma B factor antagonist